MGTSSNSTSSSARRDDRARTDSVKEHSAPIVIVGDSDVVRPEHAVEIFRLLGSGVAGEIASLPGTTHITLVDRVDWLLSLIAAFLDAPMT